MEKIYVLFKYNLLYYVKDNHYHYYYCKNYEEIVQAIENYCINNDRVLIKDSIDWDKKNNSIDFYYYEEWDNNGEKEYECIQIYELKSIELIK